MSYSWGFRAPVVRRVPLKTCFVCDGSTLGSYGEQCRHCHGKGFVEQASAYHSLGRADKHRDYLKRKRFA